VTLTCGQRTNENCTYFESSSGAVAGGCSATVCPINANICQLRLVLLHFLLSWALSLAISISQDFNNFVVTGPSTATGTVANLPLVLGGAVSALLPIVLGIFVCFRNSR